MKIVFFGASKFVIPVINKLSINYNLELVITTENKRADAVPFYCLENKIPFLPVVNFDDDIKSRLKGVNATAAVLAYFGVLLHKDILNIFPKGIINIHPSLLPRYRGATPVQSAILNGDHETGVTIIRLDAQMDHGPMLAAENEPIHDDDTTESLHARLFQKGTDILIDVLPEYLSGKLKLQEQNDAEATFTKRSFTRQDGYIDSDNPPSKTQLDRMIRALYPWPAVWTLLKFKDQKSKIKNIENSAGFHELRIKFLPGGIIQVEGKKPMLYKDFFNGYPQLKEKLLKILPV